MNILNLTLKKKWFDMILSGEKTHEYREIKDYWDRRLNYPKQYDAIKFVNGYGRYCPQFVIALKEITVGYGNEAWGAPKDEVYILILGNIISKANINNIGKHPSHITRSSDSSMYDEVCTICGSTDISGAGWGKLSSPCVTPQR